MYTATTAARARQSMGLEGAKESSIELLHFQAAGWSPESLIPDFPFHAVGVFWAFRA